MPPTLNGTCEKFAATQDLKALRAEADRVVTRHFKYARIVFKKDPAALSKLNITGYWRKRMDGKIDQSTQDRNQLFNELDDWWDDFIAAMKIELAEKPQLLEKMGVQIS